MEEKMQENQISQPKVEQAPMTVSEKKVKPLTIVILLIVILLIMAGAVCAGIQIGRRSISPRELLIPPKPITTQIPIDNGPVKIEVSPTPEVRSDETANWKTYKNEKYGFEVKYPSDWVFTRQFSNVDGFFIVKNSSRLTILPKGEFDWGPPSSDPIVSNILLGGRNAKSKRWEWFEGNKKQVIIYQLTDKISNWLGCNEGQGGLESCNRLDLVADNETDFGVLTKILSTFKFLD